MGDLRVCLVGNMNNNNYILAKMLRREGVEADLILLNNEYRYFLPEHYDEDLKDGYPEWIKKVKWGTGASFFYTTKDIILKDLKGYDIYIACNLFAPAFLYKAGLIKKTIVRVHGGDLYLLPFWDRLLKTYKHYLRPFISLPVYYLSNVQKKAIKECLAVFTLPHGKIYNSILRLKILDKLKVIGAPIDTNKFSPQYVEKIIKFRGIPSKIRNIIANMEKYDFTIFSPTRHFWTKNTVVLNPEADKGNDILILGFKKFIESEKVNPLLILVEKGPDVMASKSLIKKLKIEENVLWIPEMTPSELLYLYYFSDIVADEFKDGRYASVGLEGMAMEKPVLVYIDKEFEVMTGIPFPPCMNASNPDEVKMLLKDFNENRVKYNRIGRLARIWVNRYHGKGLVRKVINLIEKLLIN